MMTTVLFKFTIRVGLNSWDVITYGELPTAPITLFLISVFRIRMAIPRAAVVNTILMNLKSYHLVNGGFEKAR